MRWEVTELKSQSTENCVQIRQTQNRRCAFCDLKCISHMLRVNIFHPIQHRDLSRVLLSLPTAVTSVYQLRSVMHALHLGNRPHTDTALAWGYSVSWHTGCGCGVMAVHTSSSAKTLFEQGGENKVWLGHKRNKNHYGLKTQRENCGSGKQMLKGLFN